MTVQASGSLYMYQDYSYSSGYLNTSSPVWTGTRILKLIQYKADLISDDNHMY